MSYANLMVQLELGRSNAGPLGVTRDLARRWHASVTGVAGAQPMQSAVMADGFYTGNIVREDCAWIDQEAKTAEEEFRAGLDGCADGLGWNMAVTRYSLSSHIADQTGDADLLVVGVDQKSDFSNSSRRVNVDDLVMHTGRPILVVPLAVRTFGFRCAMVAWKDSREARRALMDALPFLRQMDRVVVAAVVEAAQQGVAQTSLNKIVAWLGRHGIAATSRLVLASGNDGERLLDLAEDVGAELIVAGAYGHSRLREWILGGVTRDLLHQSKCCLFLSH